VPPAHIHPVLDSFGQTGLGSGMFSAGIDLILVFAKAEAGSLDSLHFTNHH
jgi:hypothetical protein